MITIHATLALAVRLNAAPTIEESRKEVIDMVDAWRKLT